MPQGMFSAEDAQPVGTQGKFRAEDIDFQPEAIDFQPESAAPPIPSIRDVMKMSGVTAPVQGPQPPKVDMQPVPSGPLLTRPERTGTRYAAAPNQQTPQERLGEMVPQAAVPALQATENALTYMPRKGGEVLGRAAERGVATAVSPSPTANPAQPKAPIPLTDQELETARQQHPLMMGAAKGIGETVGSTAADPLNWPFFASGMARPLLQRIISLGFTGMLTKGTVDAAQQLHDNWDRLTPAQRTELATQAGISGLLAGGGLMRAVNPRLAVGITPEETRIRAGINPLDTGWLTAEARIPRAPKPAAPSGSALEPPTIEGQVAEPTRAEIAEAMEATNFAGPDAYRAAHAAAKAAEVQAATAPPPVPAESVVHSGTEGVRARAASAPPAPQATSRTSLSYEQARSAAQTLLKDHGRISPTLLQRNLKLSFKNAKTVLDRMSNEGLVQTDEKGVIYRPVAQPSDAAQPAIPRLKPDRSKISTQPPKPLESIDFQRGSVVGQIESKEEPVLSSTAEAKPPASAQPVTSQARNVPGEPVKQIEEKPTKYKFGSTQANIPAESEAAKALGQARDRISKSDVMPQGGAAMGGPTADSGLETQPHVTVRYGIKGEDTEGIKKYLARLSPFEASLGETDKFAPNEHTEGAAVIIAPIEAPELHQINSELEKHGDFIEPTFKEFRPHATIGYVKPEVADRYVGMNVTTGKKFTVDSIAITDREGKEGKQELIKLEGKATGQFGPEAIDFQPETIAPKSETKPPERETAGGKFGRIDYDRMKRVYPKQKAALTRAQNLTDPGAKRDAVIKAAKEAVAEWEQIGAWPDEWSRWQRAVDDAEFTGRRAGLPAMENTRLEDLELAAPAPTKAEPRPETTKYEPKIGDLVTRDGKLYEVGFVNPGGSMRLQDPETKERIAGWHSPSEVKAAEIAKDEAIDFEPETIEAAGETKPAKSETKNPAIGLADAVYEKLKAGESLGNVTEFNKLAEQHFGSSRTSGLWSPKDAFDAMEAGVNKYLLDIGEELMDEDAIEALKELRELMPRLTSQGVRTEEQLKAQQFSTPPTEAYMVAKVANLTSRDVVLEPSAGNGGLAVFPMAIGADVHVNEIAPRRQKMLEAVGFEKPSAHDGELINSLLDQKIKPTVVLMNPPFSSAILKGREGVEVKNRNQYGFNHVDSALQRLEPGGRLVAILGGGRSGFDEGASLTASTARPWFQKVAQKYNIRANVRVSGKEYQKYGTSFATRIIVIDKIGPTPDAATFSNGRVPESIVQGDVDTLEQAYNLLRGVAEDRPAVGGKQNVAARSEGSRPTADFGRPGSARPETQAGSSLAANQEPVRPSAGTPARRSAEAGGQVQPPDRSNQPGRVAGAHEPSQGSERVPVHQPGTQPEEHPAAPAAEGVRGRGENPDRERPLQQPEVEGLTLGREAESIKEQEDSAAYVTYHPALKGPQHPGSIVESKTMATVPLPEITYKPSLPESVVKEGKLSAVQLEAVSIAGQQNDIVLPSGHRASALIGDGTGVGKGREAAAILWDNWRKGRKRLIWVSEKWDLMEDAKRDLNGIGASELAKGIKAFQKLNVTDPIEHEGILFTTYALIRSADSKGNTRAAQLQKWLRGKDEAEGGYMAFDESHNLKNAVVGVQGVASEIGKTIKKLLEENPKLRTVSLSATAASDVMNLGYLDRLGLWGPGTAFPQGFQEFAAQISGGGISAMEMVARELKAQGKYLARTLSFKGVTYDELPHKLTPEQKDLYRTAVKAWRMVSQKAEDTIKNTNNGGPRQVGRFLALFYGAQQRFFNILLTTLKIPTVVEDANKALAEKKSVVITLVNTNEAAQNREKNRELVNAGDEDEPPDYDFGPSEMLVDLVKQHYPTHQYADAVDDTGNLIKVPVVDENGNPVHNPEAIKERDALVAQIKKDLQLPKNPLDILIDSFGGSSKVAELTGRKERYDENTGKFVKRGDPGVKRSDINLSEMRGFQAGKKKIAILSNAAGTGISLQADLGVQNQDKRQHITLQAGWSADKAMQMLGRTHRANQKHPPEYLNAVTDMGGEKRFSATLAKRLGSLGALSKGQKSAINAMDKVNFESEQGRRATKTFYERLLRNQNVPGTEGWNEEKPEQLMPGMTVLRDLAVLKYDPQSMTWTVPDADRTNVTRLLNRLLALDPDVQNAVYDYFYDLFEATVQQAEEDGTLDTGVKTLPGDEFSIKEQKAVSRDPKTGADTYYYPIEARVKTERVSPAEVTKALKKFKDDDPRIMQNDKGHLIFVRNARPIVHASGLTSEAVYQVSPENGVQRKVEAYRLGGYREVLVTAKEKLDKAREEVPAAERGIQSAKEQIERYPTWQYNQDNLTRAEKRLESAKQALVEAEASIKDPHAAALEKWQEHYDAAPTHTTQEHHLIGGAVLKWWNAIRDASGEILHIYTAVDSKTGKRVVGVEIPPAAIRKLVGRISGGGSTVDARQLAIDVTLNGLSYELEGGIQVRPGRVARTKVVQLIPPNQSTAENLKRMGILYEKGLTPIYYLPSMERPTDTRPDDILNKVLKEYPVKENENAGEGESLLAGETGTFTPAALNPARINKLYDNFISRVIDRKLDLGDKYLRVADHDNAIAKLLHDKDHAPRYYRDKAQSNVDQVIKGLNEHQVRLTAMMADSDAREFLQENHSEQYQQAQDDPAVMAAVEKFEPYQDELAALRLKLGWHVRRDLSVFENEDAAKDENRWMVLDREGNPVADFAKADEAKSYVEEKGEILDHLKRTYPEHLREPLMGQTVPGSGATGSNSGGIRAPRPDKKQRVATAQYFYEHGAKDFSGYLQSFTQASHATLNQKIFDTLTEKATKWTEGTAQPPEILYRGKTYYRPDVAQSMRLGLKANQVKNPPEYRAYDPAKDDKLLIKSFEDGWATFSTGRPGISFKDRYLAPKEVVDALDNYDKTRGIQENDSVRRFFQDQIVGLFGPNIHLLNIMRRLAHVAGTGAWDPRVWPYYQKLFFSKELRDRMAQGLADDAIDALSKNGSYTNARDIGAIHDYVLGNMDPRNWARWTIGKFSKGILFDPKFLGGRGGLDQKARVLAYDMLHDQQGWSEEEASKHVEDGFGNYDRSNWTERMKRWARFLLFPGWDFSSFKWVLRHPILTAVAPAAVTMAANLAIHAAGKNKDQDKYDFAYLHYGDRKFRTNLVTESMALHLAEPVLSAAKSALEGGNVQDVSAAAGEGLLRGGGGFAGVLRPEAQAAIALLSNRQYLGGTKEIWKPEDANIPAHLPWLQTRKLEKIAVFSVVKAFPAVSRFLDSSYDNVDLATGVGSIVGVTDYKAGAEERLKANVAKSMGYSETLSKLAETDSTAAEKFVQDPNKASYLMFHNDLSELSKNLRDLDKQAEAVKLSGELSQSQRKEILRDLEAARKQILNSADALDDALTSVKLQMKRAVGQ